MGEQNVFKKKTKGKNNRNTRKQTVIHYPRNLTILCIIAVLFGMIVYHSLNVYSQESILEYPGEQSVAGYTVADNNYHIEDADTHYIDYTFDDRAIRVLWLNLSAEAAVDTNFRCSHSIMTRRWRRLRSVYRRGSMQKRHI